MLEKTALVIKANQNFIWLNNPRSNSCGHCQQNDCGVGILNKTTEQWFNRQYNSPFPRPDNTWGQNLRVGDSVLIRATEQQMLRAALWLYLWPLLLLFTFSLTYQLIANSLAWPVSDLITAASGFFGLLVGFAVVKLRQKKHALLLLEAVKTE